MRKIDYTGQFKKDYKRLKSGVFSKKIDEILEEALNYLCSDSPLPERYCDHSLRGPWQDFRDCHLKPDLVLIYKKRGSDVLELARIGSHSQLGL
jgi:mRNA interferase YafQ